MQVTGEIFQGGGSEMTAMGDASIYLINFDSHGALVDAGCGFGTEKLFRNIEECGVKPDQIEYLLITHCHFDHTGGIPGVLERVKCQVVAHEDEALFLEKGDDRVTGARWYGGSMSPIMVDRKIKGAGENIELGGRVIEAIHTPGHSPGSMVFVTESEGLKILFGQDVHGPLDESLLSNRKQYRESLNMLIDMEADILCEGHFGIYRGKAEVKKFIKSFL